VSADSVRVSGMNGVIVDLCKHLKTQFLTCRLGWLVLIWS